MKKIIVFFSIFSIWSVLLPATIGLLSFKKIALPSKIIWGMTVFAVVPQLIRYAPFMDGHRYLFYNLYLLTEVVFYSFYFFIILEEKRCYNIIISFPITFGIIYLLIGFYKNIAKSFFYEAVCLDNIFVLFFVLLVFYNGYSKNDIYFTSKNPNVYYLIGMFFYAPITAIIYSLWDFLHTNPDSQLQNLYAIHDICNGLMYLLFSVGLVIDFTTINIKKWQL